MYTPTIWANPRNLELINEKRQKERSNELRVKEKFNDKKSISAKLTERLNNVFSCRLKLNFEM